MRSVASLEERIADLEARATAVEQRVEDTQRALQREQQEREVADAREEAAMVAATRDLHRKMERLAVSGTGAEFVGWVWLALGLLLTTWSAGLGSALPPQVCHSAVIESQVNENAGGYAPPTTRD